MTFEPIQKFLPRAANRHGIKKELTAAEICHHFRTLTPKIFPKIADATRHITPAHFKNAELVINASSPAFAQEVIMRKPQIIAEINQKAGQKIIKNLRTQIRNPQSTDTPPEFSS